MSGKVWLIGLDGASFEIMKPLFAAGKLPFLKKTIANGASGVLSSTIVPFTPQAWGTVITGNNPGRHGIFGFVRQMPGRPPEFLSSRTLKGEKLWTYLGREGLKSLVVNVPLTYPPTPLNGAMVTGMMTPSIEKQFTYPPELREWVLSKWPSYKLDVTSTIERSRNLAFLDEVEEAMNMNVELTLSLIEERSPDFLFKVFIMPDRIQHAYCQFLHPESTEYDSPRAQKWRSRIWDLYEKMDRAIEKICAEASSDTDIIFASDHGFAMEKGGFFTNDFLARSGLLALSGDGNPGVGVLREFIKRFDLSKIKKFIPNRIIRQTINMTKESIDWEKTLAYASPVAQQGINVNLKGREPDGVVDGSHYDEVRDRIIDELTKLYSPELGESPVRGYKREDIFTGDYIVSIPDIVLDFSSSKLEAKEAVLGGPPFTRSGGGSRGIHHRNGVFAAMGPRINKGVFEGLALEDLAPNILALYGVPGFDTMDGRLRSDVFKVSE